MVFSSVSFIFLFLPALLAAYYIVPARFRAARNAVLLLASLGFYAWGEPVYVLVMLGSIAANYAFGLAAGAKKSRAVVAAAAAVNLGALMLFKYADFFITNLNLIPGVSIPLLGLTMPIGISFFTFQGLSYVVDVYRGDAPAQKNPANVALYIALFPQLIAGPIVRYETVALELTNRRETADDFVSGLRRFTVGLAKKALIANAVGEAAAMAFDRGDALTLGAPAAWLGAICFALQIYFDFSGYSDMAIGLGKMFGFHFLENFNYPYAADSITDFWRRWHISLSTFFRDYVYIPLGGNRCSKAKNIRNLAVVWLLTGFWHGASWNFLIWGGYFGALLILEKYVFGKLIARLPSAVRRIYSLALVLFGWVIFNTRDAAHMVSYFGAMFGAGEASFANQWEYVLLQYGAAIAIALLASIPVKPWIEKHLARAEGSPALALARNAGALALFAVSVVYLLNTTFNPFIYFRF